MGYLEWCQGNGGTAWSCYSITTSYPKGGCALQVIDFDQDGVLDILAGGRDDGAYYYFNNNNGGGTFTSQTVATGFQQAQAVLAYDVDQDGKMDVVANTWLNGNVMWCVPS